jgi:hypothetical protein
MLIKLSEILKQQGLFSQDIKARLKNKQISINGESISEDINIDCSIIKNTKKDATGQCFNNDIADVIDAGDFLFNLIRSNEKWQNQIRIFGFEELFDTNIENELTLFLKSFIFLKISKKQIFILKRAI